MGSKLRGKLRNLLHEVQDSFAGPTLLEEWYDKWNNDVAPRLTAFHLFSPEYLELYEKTWQDYDDALSSLEATSAGRSKQQHSRPRPEWQPQMSQQRERARQLLKFRAVVYSPMSPDKMHSAPLQAYLYRKLDTPLETQRDDRMFCWRATLDNWSSFQKQAATDSDFYNGLSAAQTSAFEMLRDWWDSCYSDPALVGAARAFMEARRHQESYSSPMNDQAVIDATRLDESLYHTDCFYLFCAEFHPRTWEPYTSEKCMVYLKHLRQLASWTAISTRLAYSVARPSQGKMAPGTPFVHPVRKDNLWFDKVDREDQYRPFYLWDSERRATVEVGKEFGPADCPDYTCISHTWGRWRIRGQAAEVPGVAWPVPENTLYDVRELPEMLSRLGERYVWFDLFCIPQIRGDPRAEEEIARQAAIFRHSKRCIAWLNLCTSWHGVVAALRWLACHFLKMAVRGRAGEGEAGRALAATVGDGNEPIELMSWDESSSFFGFNPWFTSLWTLQEAALCPEIELYSRDWERLRVHDGEPLSLTTMAIFLTEVWAFCTPKKQMGVPFSSRARYTAEANPGGAESLQLYPKGVKDLMGLVFGTQLDQVLTDLSPIRILAAGGMRHYSPHSDRSQAIMSAIGVTDWYRARQDSDAGASMDSMVLGNYSLAFIREAARKIGGEFYTGARSLAEKGHLVSSGARGPGGLVGGEGTMLPVPRVAEVQGERHASGTAVIVPIGDGYINPQDHPSLAGWTIRPDAGVEMRSVGITAVSNARVHMACQQARIDWLSSRPGEDPEQLRVSRTTSGDLCEYLTEIAQGATLYAVALFQSSQSQTGVVLAPVPDQDGSSRTRLVKIGNYELLGVPLPPTTEVNWVVL